MSPDPSAEARRAHIDAGIAKVWDRLQKVGEWFDSDTRLAIALEARCCAKECKACKECKDVCFRPGTEAEGFKAALEAAHGGGFGSNTQGGKLSPLLASMVHTLANNQSRIDRPWAESAVDALGNEKGLEGLARDDLWSAYLEVSSVVASSIAVSKFYHLMGEEDPWGTDGKPLRPQGGEPARRKVADLFPPLTRESPACFLPSVAKLPKVLPLHPWGEEVEDAKELFKTALAPAGPGKVASINTTALELLELTNAGLYICAEQITEMAKFLPCTVNRKLNRSQIEAVASQTAENLACNF